MRMDRFRTGSSLREALLSVIVACATIVAGSGCGTPDASGTPLMSGRGQADDAEEADDEGSGEDVLAEQGGGSLETGTTTPTSVSPCAANDLTLCFRFEGAATDESAMQLQPAVASGISFVAGKEGKGAAFEPTSALRFAPSAAFDLPADGATIEAFIMRTATGADAVVFDDDERFSLTINAAGKVWCKTSTGALVGATIIPEGKWVHVACVVDQGALRAYVDGVVDAIGAGSIGKAVTPAAAAIGGNSPSGEEFRGTIDVLRVFKVARTDAQIAAASKGLPQ